MNERGYYGGTRRDVRLAGVFERVRSGPDRRLTDAVIALGQRAQQQAWRWLEERGTPNGWLYTTSADISKEHIEAIEPGDARRRLHHLMESGNVGFWAIFELGASAPKLVDLGVTDASGAYLVGSPLVADQRATAVRGYVDVGAQQPTPAVGPERKPLPWWGGVLTSGLAIGFVGALGYAFYGLVKTHRDDEKEATREKRVRATWSPSRREQWSDSGLTVDAFEDWLKTGRGMTAREWIRATPGRESPVITR